MKPKALVIGCSGQDGSYMVKSLLLKGYEVIGTSRSKKVLHSNHKTLGISNQFLVHQVDNLNSSQISDLIVTEKPSEIYNLAAQSSVGKSFKEPLKTEQSIVMASEILLSNCRKHNFSGRIFFAGSSEIYGLTKKPAKIDSAFNPQNPYADAKLESMNLVKKYRNEYGIKAVTGVLFPHESPLRTGQFVTKKIVDAAKICNLDKSHKIELGNLNISRDWGWAEEYVEAMYLINNRKNGVKDHIICTGILTSLETFIDKVFKLFNLNWQDHIIINKKYFRSTDIEKSFGDPKQIFNDLQWKSKKDIDSIIKNLINSNICQKI